MQQETIFYSANSEQDAAKEARKQKRRKFVLAAEVLYLLLIALVFFVLINRTNAMRAIERLDFQGAVTAFSRIPLRQAIFPKDSAYISAAKLAAEHQYDEAAAAFGKLTDDPRAEIAVSETKYQKAVSYYTSGDFEAASAAFKDAGEYRDSVLMDQDSRCQLAAKYVAETEYDKAFLILQKLFREKYEPATEQLYLAYLSKAELFASKNAYADGLSELLNAKKYGDISAQLPVFQEKAYLEAAKMYRKGENIKARRVFSKLGDYLQPEDYILLIDLKESWGLSWKITENDRNRLPSLIGFEDTAEVIMAFDQLATTFLMGNWTGQDKYFSVRQGEDAIYIGFNIPAYDYGDYYIFEDGKMLAYPEKDATAKKKFFQITVISNDCIKIYAYNGGETYTLYRN